MKKKELVTELKGLTVADLRLRARKMAEELMKLRFRKSAGQLEQSHQVQRLRRDLARAKTLASAKASAVSSKAS